MKSRVILLIVVLVPLQLEAHSLPPSYQQFKTEFMNYQPGGKIELARSTKIWLGIGTGSVIFATSGYFLSQGHQDKFEATILIGSAVYIPVLILLIIADDSNGGFPYY